MPRLEAKPKSYPTPIVLVGGGHIYQQELLKALLDRGFPLVAADGGAEACLDLGLTPELVIGDGDSWHPASPRAAEITSWIIGEQESTDFEKCLLHLDAPLFYAFGFTGKRFDHTLAAMHVLAKHTAKKNIILLDEIDLVAGFSSALSLALKADTRLSIYPLQPSRFRRSEGLVYPLDGLTLSQGERLGCSNAASGGKVLIEPEAGAVFALILGAEWLEQAEEAMLNQPPPLSV